MAQELTPQQVVDFVSELFEAFDELADHFGADKIKTIGDAYVVCAGALSPCETHEATMVALGLSMVEAVVAKSKEKELDVGARIGVHTGLVIGGIIGTVKFHFDMWGNGSGHTQWAHSLHRRPTTGYSEAQRACRLGCSAA